MRASRDFAGVLAVVPVAAMICAATGRAAVFAETAIEVLGGAWAQR